MQSFLRKLGLVACILGAAFLIVGAVWVLVPKYHHLCAIEAKCHRLRACVDAKQREIESIRDKQKRLQNDPEFLARIAHQNRRVFPNELVFLFDDK